MYSVMGITGQVGGAAARTLLAGGHAVRGIARDPAKAADWASRGVTLATADQTDPVALANALRGTDAAFVMLPPLFVQTPGSPEARPLIDALRQAVADAGVPRVVVLSTVGAHLAQGTGILGALHLLESAMDSLPIPVTFVRAAWFMENAAWDIQPAFDTGRLNSFLQPVDRPIAMVSVEDVGRVVAETLVTPSTGHCVIELEGPKRYAPIDVAAALQTLVRRPVRTSAVPRSDWSAAFEAQGASPEAAALRAEMLDGFNSGHVDFAGGPGTEHVVGRVSLDDAVGRLAGA